MQHAGHLEDPPRTVFTDLPGDLYGYYDHDTGRVFVDRRMSEAKKRCTLVHESFHRLLGHKPLASKPEHVRREIATERASALHLIDFPLLLGAMCRNPDSLEAVALDLMVDVETLLARILGLSPIEQTILEACGRHCIGFGSEQAARPAPVTSLARRTVPVPVG